MSRWRLAGISYHMQTDHLVISRSIVCLDFLKTIMKTDSFVINIILKILEKKIKITFVIQTSFFIRGALSLIGGATESFF